MCGIVGVISNAVLTQAQKKIFKQLIEVDALRGHHSTGVLGVSNHNRTEIFKKAVASQEFFQYSEYDSITTGNNALIGHNRWATCGDLIHQNAHPFQHGDISGVHNGTLDNQYDLVDYLEYDVDSENIFVSMSKIGEQATIEKLEGAFTLVWHNKKNRTINFVRNEERVMDVLIQGEDGMEAVTYEDLVELIQDNKQFTYVDCNPDLKEQVQKLFDYYDVNLVA